MSKVMFILDMSSSLGWPCKIYRNTEKTLSQRKEKRFFVPNTPTDANLLAQHLEEEQD